jgi:hypothetical protein
MFLCSSSSAPTRSSSSGRSLSMHFAASAQISLCHFPDMRPHRCKVCLSVQNGHGCERGRTHDRGGVHQCLLVTVAVRCGHIGRVPSCLHRLCAYAERLEASTHDRCVVRGGTGPRPGDPHPQIRGRGLGLAQSHRARIACASSMRCRARYPVAAGVAWSSQYPAHAALYQISSESFPKFLAFVTASNVCSSR